jgi:hypothetical protein
MSKTIDQGKDEVATLCQYFATNRQSFLAPGVKEAHVRQSLIDPFFEALGWDVRNDSMAAPQYREVIIEDSLDVEGQQKAPDYTFRLGTLPKFYVEAKKCGVNISADPAPAYQLRRYGFSAKLALSILTDFEELGVYDCASRPRPGDKASHARIQYFGFTEYPDRWREIWDVFSREAVWSGTFDQYAASKRKRGTSEVDGEFLKDIEGWRDVLARNLALRNSDLSADDLNAAVQRIIDRIVFLRMAEDRGLESYGQLLKLCEQSDIYDRFMSGLCRKADQKYNSGLFHFQKEPGISDAPDTLTPSLAVDDNALKPILQSLYFEHGSPYNFGVLPVEILGTVYERFLGKVIRLTAGHQAKVEEKPEVRKAGGVYYTPAYIVNYIVLNTIGKQIEGKSPSDLAGGKTMPPFRVLDMACGSGSFLLGAYQFLLDHCLKWYLANLSKKHAKAVYQNAKGETRLTIAERKRILTTHIYGVDIDRQAVETTKLSLLLKALEGENDTTLSRQMTLFHERALPNLYHNIKCGNSLIASDFSMVPEDLVRVHAFDWSAQFPDAMKSGGFDTIIGNPPYIRPHKMESEIKEYFWKTLPTFVAKSDIYSCFMERAIGLLKIGGHLSFIVPHTWTSLESFYAIRHKLVSESEILQLVRLPKKVFQDATVETCIFNLRKSSGNPSPAHQIEVSRLDSSTRVAIVRTFPQSDILKGHLDNFQLYTAQVTSGLASRLQINTAPLGEFTNFVYGFKTANDEKFIHNEALHKESKAFIRSAAIFRYAHDRPSEFVWYVPEIMRANRTTARPGEPERFEAEKILVARMGKKLIASYDKGGLYVKDAMLLLRKSTTTESLKYLLALINSRLLGFYYREFFITIDVLKNAILELPIRKIDFASPPDKKRHDRLVAMVEKMLALVPKLRGATAESEKAALQNAVTTTDVEIDRLVYELYGLTEEEIKIVESVCCQ